MATGENCYKESDGKAVNVTLSHSVQAKQVAYVEGFLGITAEAGDSGDRIALTIEPCEYQFTVPADLAVSKGDTVYIDTTDLTGHTPDETGYAKASGANLIPLFKATEDEDANNNVTGIFLGQ